MNAFATSKHDLLLLCCEALAASLSRCVVQRAAAHAELCDRFHSINALIDDAMQAGQSPERESVPPLVHAHSSAMRTLDKLFRSTILPCVGFECCFRSGRGVGKRPAMVGLRISFSEGPTSDLPDASTFSKLVSTKGQPYMSFQSGPPLHPLLSEQA